MVKALVSRPPLLQNSAVQELLAVIPPHLHSSLLPFQKEAVVFAIERGGRCLLADEMGLGKTVQSIAVAGGKLLSIYY
jgi:SNF2 family DNA or RNA helicase